MKICYVANFRIPTEKAHGYQVAKMCESFVLAGHEVELWVPTRKNDIREDFFEYYDLERNFKITRIFVADFIAMTPLFLRRAGFLLQSLFYLAALFVKRKSFLSSLSLGSNIQNKNLSFKGRGDEVAVFSRNPEVIFLFSRLGHKTIFESHRFPQTKKNLHVFLVKKAAKIITVTKALKELYVKSGIDENKILVASDGVDLEVFDIDVSKEKAREELRLPSDVILSGYTGSLETMGEEKGVAEIFYALRKIVRDKITSKKIMFVAVGGSARQHEKYKPLIRDFAVESSVLFIESTERKKLAVYQKAFDMLLMPFPRSVHYSFYMSPMKMFEYMASRRPIVATDLPSVREVLNESNALLVEPNNPESLAQGIEKLINNPELAQKISSQAYEDVRRYTWEKRSKRIIEFIS